MVVMPSFFVKVKKNNKSHNMEEGFIIGYE